MTRLIKRYGNRKMYDTRASRYVTLDDIAGMVRAGEDLRIVDNDTGEDLTAVTFAQIIFEAEKRQAGPLGLPVLRWIIQQGGATVQDILDRVDRGREALGSVRDFAEKGMKQLTQGPGPAHREVSDRDKRAGVRVEHPNRTNPSGRRLLNEILELPQRQIEQLQQRIDAQVRASLDRVTAHPTFQSELRRIEQSIKGLERQLGRLRRRGHVLVPSRRMKRSRSAARGGPPRAAKKQKEQ